MRVPEWETTPYSSEAASGYGTYESLADLFREIGHEGGRSQEPEPGPVHRLKSRRA